MRQFLIAFIKAYRLVLSPFLGHHCRFEPTCSCYAIEALSRYGALYGSWLTLRRLLRCHPFSPGGYDPVPDPQHKPNHGQPTPPSDHRV